MAASRVLAFGERDVSRKCEMLPSGPTSGTHKACESHRRLLPSVGEAPCRSDMQGILLSLFSGLSYAICLRGFEDLNCN